MEDSNIPLLQEAAAERQSLLSYFGTQVTRSINWCVHNIKLFFSTSFAIVSNSVVWSFNKLKQAWNGIKSFINHFLYGRREDVLENGQENAEQNRQYSEEGARNHVTMICTVWAYSLGFGSLFLGFVGLYLASKFGEWTPGKAYTAIGVIFSAVLLFYTCGWCWLRRNGIINKYCLPCWCYGSGENVLRQENVKNHATMICAVWAFALGFGSLFLGFVGLYLATTTKSGQWTLGLACTAMVVILADVFLLYACGLCWLRRTGTISQYYLPW